MGSVLSFLHGADISAGPAHRQRDEDHNMHFSIHEADALLDAHLVSIMRALQGLITQIRDDPEFSRAAIAETLTRIETMVMDLHTSIDHAVIDH